MMGQVKFGGTWWDSIDAAADAWAASALPDVGVVGVEERAESVAFDLEDHWWDEAQRVGDGAPGGVPERSWRVRCRHALADRIEASRLVA